MAQNQEWRYCGLNHGGYACVIVNECGRWRMLKVNKIILKFEGKHKISF